MESVDFRFTKNRNEAWLIDSVQKHLSESEEHFDLNVEEIYEAVNLTKESHRLYYKIGVAENVEAISVRFKRVKVDSATVTIADADEDTIVFFFEKNPFFSPKVKKDDVKADSGADEEKEKKWARPITFAFVGQVHEEVESAKADEALGNITAACAIVAKSYSNIGKERVKQVWATGKALFDAKKKKVDFENVAFSRKEVNQKDLATYLPKTHPVIQYWRTGKKKKKH